MNNLGALFTYGCQLVHLWIPPACEGIRHKGRRHENGHEGKVILYFVVAPEVIGNIWRNPNGTAFPIGHLPCYNVIVGFSKSLYMPAIDVGKVPEEFIRDVVHTAA